MFTGIIEETGTVEFVRHASTGARFGVKAKVILSDLTKGASIAVNGVCLTAVAIGADSFEADLAPETLERSNLGELHEGSLVNLERPLLPTSRLSGHIVQGHVDATAEIVELKPLGDGNWWLTIRIPHSLEQYFVEKGSITIDGISLTIASIEGDRIGVTIIPHTYEHTAMRQYSQGARANIECDVIAKHVERLLAYRQPIDKT
ncbi:MAG TPA: riboflavin synthase [Bryobacteraceae bacterium]|jgi:riboflavin synthase